MAIGQTLFNSSLGDALRQFAPNVDAEKVIHAGASDVRNVVSGVDLEDVLLAFNQATKHEFYFAAALSSATVLSCLGMGWKRIAKKGAAEEAAKAKAAKRQSASADGPK